MAKARPSKLRRIRMGATRRIFSMERKPSAFHGVGDTLLFMIRYRGRK